MDLLTFAIMGVIPRHLEVTLLGACTGRPPRSSEVLYDATKTPYLVEKQVLMWGRDLVDAHSV